MLKIIKIGVGFAVFILLIATASFAYNRLMDRELQKQSGVLEPDHDRKEAADFTMTDREGNTLTLHGIIENGKPVVLNFWASWCPPCRAEMPDFEKVYAELGNEVQFIMLNLADGTRETKEIGIKFIDEQGYTFPVFFDSGKSGAVAYAVRTIPTTLFIDRDGYVVNRKQGLIKEDELKAFIEQIRF